MENGDLVRVIDSNQSGVVTKTMKVLDSFLVYVKFPIKTMDGWFKECHLELIEI